MKKINVIAFGGLGGAWFSTGLQTLLNKMKAAGLPIDYSSFEDYTSWKSWGTKLRGWSDNTVLIGHSFGVTAAMATVRAKGASGTPIPLVISYDPSQWWAFQPSLWGSGGNSVPMSVGRAVNFYQRSLPIGYQTISRDDGSTKNVVNELITGYAHGAMDEVPALHTRSIEEVRKVVASL